MVDMNVDADFPKSFSVRAYGGRMLRFSYEQRAGRFYWYVRGYVRGRVRVMYVGRELDVPVAIREFGSRFGLLDED